MALIHLVRHGRSALTHDGRWIDVAGFDRFVEAYDDAGIATSEQPGAELVALSAPATRIFASDMRRAIESAERLAFGRPIVTSPLVREVTVALPRIPIPLPLDVWDTVCNAVWMVRSWTGADGNGAILRAREAARWLAAGAVDNDPLVVVTHGTFRALVARELEGIGTRQTSGKLDFRNWSVWSFDTTGAR